MGKCDSSLVPSKPVLAAPNICELARTSQSGAIFQVLPQYVAEAIDVYEIYRSKELLLNGKAQYS